MKRLGVYAFIATLLVSVVGGFLTPSSARAQTTDQGTYESYSTIIQGYTTAAMAAYDTAATNDKSVTSQNATRDYKAATQSNYDAYLSAFNTARANGIQPAAAQIAGINAWNASVEANRDKLNVYRSGSQWAAYRQLSASVSSAFSVASRIQSGNLVAGSQEAAVTTNSAETITRAANPVAPPPSSCNLLNGNLVDCVDSLIAWIIKHTFIQIAGFLVWLTANMMNFAIQISILNFKNWAPDTLYPIWIIIRQIVSLFVVFAGLWLGFMYIIGREDTFGKYVGWLVLFALFVNFSYPITRALTDVSNIISLNVYVAAVGSGPITTDFSNAATSFGQDTAGALIMNRLGLAGLVGSAEKVSDQQSKLYDGINTTAGALITLAFMLYTAYVFFMATAIIATRTAVLVFLIVASPLLLVDSVIPKLGEVAMKMRKMFFEQLVVAPVFMIMLALTLKFMQVFQTGPLAQNTTTAFTGSGSIQTFFSVLMMLIMLHIMLKVTKSLAGEAGTYATNMMGKVGGFGLGMAAGGAGLLARGTVGAAASRFQNSAWMDSMQGSKIGRGLYGLSNSLAQSTFDSRNIGMVSKGMASAGMGMGAGSAANYEKNFAARQTKVTTKYESIKDDKARAAYYESTKNSVRSKMGRTLLGGESDGDKIAKQLDLKEMELKKKEAASIESFTTGTDDSRKEMIMKAQADNNGVLTKKLLDAQKYFDAQGVGTKSDALVAMGDSKAALSIIENDPFTGLQKENLDNIKKLEQAAAIELQGSDKQKELLRQVEVKRKENREMVDTFRKDLKDNYFLKNYARPVDVDLSGGAPGDGSAGQTAQQNPIHPGGSDTVQYNDAQYTVPAYQRTAITSSSFAESMRRKNGGASPQTTTAPVPKAPSPQDEPVAA
jgi:hypothetical protein